MGKNYIVRLVDRLLMVTLEPFLLRLVKSTYASNSVQDLQYSR